MVDPWTGKVDDDSEIDERADERTIEEERKILEDEGKPRTIYTVHVSVPVVLATSEATAIMQALAMIEDGKHTVRVQALAHERKCAACGEGLGTSRNWYCSQRCKAEILGTDED